MTMSNVALDVLVALHLLSSPPTYTSWLTHTQTHTHMHSHTHTHTHMHMHMHTHTHTHMHTHTHTHARTLCTGERRRSRASYDCNQ